MDRPQNPLDGLHGCPTSGDVYPSIITEVYLENLHILIPGQYSEQTQILHKFTTRVVFNVDSSASTRSEKRPYSIFRVLALYLLASLETEPSLTIPREVHLFQGGTRVGGELGYLELEICLL